MLDRALGAIDLISLWTARLGALFMALIATLMLSEIGSRYFVGRSLGMTWELATYAMAAVIFLGAADTLRTGGHVRVGVLLETLPAALSRAVDIIATLIALFIVGFILSAVGDFVMNNMQRGTRSFEPSRIYLWIPQSVLVIGMLLLFLQLAARLLRLLTGRPVQVTQTEMKASETGAAGMGKGADL
jgi:TRAP-type C4-dicarboxylate transport system permease small subunit